MTDPMSAPPHSTARNAPTPVMTAVTSKASAIEGMSQVHSGMVVFVSSESDRNAWYLMDEVPAILTDNSITQPPIHETSSAKKTARGLGHHETARCRLLRRIR